MLDEKSENDKSKLYDEFYNYVSTQGPTPQNGPNLQIKSKMVPFQISTQEDLSPLLPSTI